MQIYGFSMNSLPFLPTFVPNLFDMIRFPRLSLHSIFAWVLALLCGINKVAAQKVWHVAERGDDLNSIALIYSTTTQELARLNPHLGANLHVGDTVWLPSLNVYTLSRYHMVSRVETAFSIAHRYGISLQKLLKANPSIYAENLKTGTVLSIPPNEATRNMNPQNVTSNEDENRHKQTHKIEAGETFYGIAQQYNLSVEQLLAANPQIDAQSYLIKTGDILNIPVALTTETEIDATTNTKEKPLSLMRVCVSLPFDDKNKCIKNLCLNYYRGLLEAANEIKEQGVSMDFYAFRSGTDATQISSAFSKNTSAGCDLLIGPYYPGQLLASERFAEKENAHWLIPFNYSGTAAYQNHRAYAAQPPASYFYSDQAEMLTERFKSRHLILIDNQKLNGALAFEVLKSTNQYGYPTVSTLKLPLSEKILLKAISTQKPNVLVCDAQRPADLLRAARMVEALKATHPQISLSLYWCVESFSTLPYLLSTLPDIEMYVGFAAQHKWSEKEWSKLLPVVRKNFGNDLKREDLLMIALGYDAGHSLLGGLAHGGPNFKNQGTTFKPFSAWSGYASRAAAVFHLSTNGNSTIEN